MQARCLGASVDVGAGAAKDLRISYLGVFGLYFYNLRTMFVLPPPPPPPSFVVALVLILVYLCIYLFIHFWVFCLFVWVFFYLDLFINLSVYLLLYFFFIHQFTMHQHTVFLPHSETLPANEIK